MNQDQIMKDTSRTGHSSCPTSSESSWFQLNEDKQLFSKHKDGTPGSMVGSQHSWRGDGAFWAVINFKKFFILKEHGVQI